MAQSGEFDRKIQLGNKKLITDDRGFQSYKFETIAKPWAKIETAQEEVQINENLESVLNETVTFTIYYRKGVTKNMSIIYNGDEYIITGVLNKDFKNEYLVLFTERDDSRGQ